MDVERTIEFILQHQASFAAGMEEMRHQQAEMRHQQAELQKDHRDLVSLVGQLTQHLILFQSEMRIFQSEMRTFQTEVRTFQTEVRAGILALTEAQQHTEERLNALITVVNGLVRRPKQ